MMSKNTRMFHPTLVHIQVTISNKSIYIRTYNITNKQITSYTKPQGWETEVFDVALEISDLHNYGDHNKNAYMYYCIIMYVQYFAKKTKYVTNVHEQLMNARNALFRELNNFCALALRSQTCT